MNLRNTCAIRSRERVPGQALGLRSRSFKTSLTLGRSPLTNKQQYIPLRVLCKSVKKDQKKNVALEKFRAPTKEEASLRAEAEAPFRSLRIVLFGFGLVSAALATLFSIPTLIGSLGGAINAKPITEALQDIGINVSALTICGYLLKGDLDAREKQMARLMREDQLGTCQIELANGKILRLGQLRGSVRPVIVVGTEEQVAQAVAAAEPLREKLAERGLMIVAVPIYQQSNSSEAADDSGARLPPMKEEDLRWRANPIRIGEWKAWFDEQAAASNKATDQGLYVGLRLDGRVRASGRGCPPWDIFAAQLPPVEGFFSGLWDGMDGRV